MAYKLWTNEETRYLEEKWGVISIAAIAKKLGRSVIAVKQKASYIGLGDASTHYDGLTLGQLSLVLDVGYSTLKYWIKMHELPVKYKVFTEKKKICVVRYDDFWKWAAEHKHRINFARIESGSIGLEPNWVKEKRAADHIKVQKIKKSNNNAWTEEEDNILKGMLNAYCYTYPQIAERLKRSEAAIKTRIYDLGILARPVHLNNHVKYTPEEEMLIISLFERGHCLEDIAARLNKSALGVRGKMERMGYRFKNGVPAKEKVVG